MAQQSNALLDNRHPLTLQLHTLSKPSVLNQSDLTLNVFLQKRHVDYRRRSSMQYVQYCSPAVQLRLCWHLTMRM